MFETTLREIRFETKEQAEKFKTEVTKDRNIRIKKLNLRKSLPEFKNIVCNDYSIFIKCFAFVDEILLMQKSKIAPGRITRCPKSSIRIIVGKECD